LLDGDIPNDLTSEEQYIQSIRPQIWLFGTLVAAVSAVLLSSCSFSDRALETPDIAVPTPTTPSKIAITIDDLPYVMFSRTTPQEGLGYVQRINETLLDHKIVATGFAVGQQVTDETTPALQAFSDAGHAVGNHSWSHPDYGTLTSEQFRTQTLQTDRVL
jgi:peptidoglycan/xylan/chitin deacetylase (PgdA/CDA1 family)